MALMDFIRPQWKHSNPGHRAQAVRLLEDDRQDVFLPSALGDPEAGIRLQAAKRVLGEAGLRRLVADSQDKTVQEVARKALMLTLAEKAKTTDAGSDKATLSALLREIQGEGKAVEDVARKALSPEARRMALGLLSHAGSVLAAVLEEEVPEIALGGLEKLSREAHLQSVAKNARCREARALAKERLKTLETGKKPDETAMLRAKLQWVFGVGEKAEAGSASPGPTYAWEAMRAQLDEAEKAWQDLVADGAPNLGADTELFRTRISAFRDRYARHLANEAARGAQEKAAQRMREAKEEERIEREKLRRQRELEDAERRKAEDEALRARQEESRLRAEAWGQGARELEDGIAELEVLVESPDLGATEKRFRAIHAACKGLLPKAYDAEGELLTARYRAAAERVRETLDWHRWSNLRRKQDFCAALEALPASEDRKAMVARFKEILAEWKTVGPVPWENTETVWDRYHTACDALYEKCREYFAELDEERESNAKAKEEICARLETILASEFDWREATETFKEAQSAWKAVGAVPREKSDSLWSRYRTACQDFYGRKDKHHDANLIVKLQLAAEAEGLRDSTEWKNTAAKIKEAQEKWKSVGPVPRDQAEALWQRFHGACEAFFQARRAHFDRLELDRPANLQKKIALCEQVEGLAALPDDEARYRLIRDAQAQWKDVGPGPQDQEEAVWERFRKPIDAYFQDRKQRLEPERKQREENTQIKEDLCAEAESLRDSTDWKPTVDRMKSLQARWKATGPAPRPLDNELWRRFRAACDGFFDRLKEHGAQRDQERITNFRRKEALCYTAEILSGRSFSDEEKQARETWLEARKAEGLDISLPAGPLDWAEATEKVKALQTEWKKIGPVPRDENEAIWERFLRSCDVFFEERRRSMGHPADDPQANLESKLALIEEAENLSPSAGSEETVGELRRRWKKIGPVPRAQSDYVWERFNAACDAALHGPETASETLKNAGSMHNEPSARIE